MPPILKAQQTQKMHTTTNMKFFTAQEKEPNKTPKNNKGAIEGKIYSSWDQQATHANVHRMGNIS